MNNKPAVIVAGVAVALVIVTAVATVVSTSSGPAPSQVSDLGTVRPSVDPREPNGTGTKKAVSAPSQSGPAQPKLSQPAAAEKPAQPVEQPVARAAAPSTASKSMVWETSYESALKKAKTTGKPIMIDFFATWCGPCKILDSDIYTAPEVIADAAQFVNVKLDADVRADIHQKFGITAYPTIVWLDSNGTEVKRLQGLPPTPGYMQEQMQQALTSKPRESVL